MTLGSTQHPTEMSTIDIFGEPKGDRRVGLTTVLPSCVNCIEIWDPQSSGDSKALSRPV
jgi:hypothetical protein